MPFKPGESGNPTGRPKGAIGKTNENLRQKIGSFLQNKWDQIETDFAALKPRERIVMYEKLLQYALPQLSRVEYFTDLERQIDQLSPEEADKILEELSDRFLNSLWIQKQN